MGLPAASDLQGAAEAMIRLQETYNLPTNATADGIIQGFYAGQSLTPEDCYQIGRTAYEVQQYGFSAQWLEKALQGLDLVGPWLTDALYLLGNSYKKVGEHDSFTNTFCTLEYQLKNTTCLLCLSLLCWLPGL